jgi:hypothetical protein
MAKLVSTHQQGRITERKFLLDPEQSPSWQLYGPMKSPDKTGEFDEGFPKEHHVGQPAEPVCFDLLLRSGLRCFAVVNATGRRDDSQEWVSLPDRTALSYADVAAWRTSWQQR